MPQDHNPIVIDSFGGLFQRGDPEACPPDHFQDCNNIQFLTSKGFRTRDGIDTYNIHRNVVRIYTFVQQTKESLLVLDDLGNIYDTGSATPNTPILSIAAMKDFGMISYAGRAYITPNDGSIGLSGDFLYVYKGDGTTARKAGGAAPTTAPAAAMSATAGNVEAGWHVFAVVYETDTGFLTKIGPGVALQVTDATHKVDISSIPVSPDSFVVARRIVATKSIDPTLWDGNLLGYQFFEIPDGRIADNTTTSLTVNFYDEDLITDASPLLDLFESISAGAGLCTYHGRLVLYGENANISLARVSNSGEPEAFDSVTGLVIFPLDGNPITNGQEFRDVLYLFKKSKTASVVDNGDDPTSWPIEIIDNGIGSPLHGVATILDSAGVNIDCILVANENGLFIFTGYYERAELSFKIKDYWFTMDRTKFNKVQIVNDTLYQIIYIVMPNGLILIADHCQGLDPKNIRWAIWSFDILATAVALINTTTLIIATTGNT